MNYQAVAAYDWLLKPSARWLEIPILIGFNLFLVATAYISIVLPFSPVPITGQTFGVILTAMLLGRTRGVVVVAAYLAEGAAGLPVLAGGRAGIASMIGPTGGYLIGFLAAAAIIGFFSDKGWHRSFVRSLSAMLCGQVAIYACGLTWLSIVVPDGPLLELGLWPFLPGAIVKMAVAAAILPSMYRLLKRE
jgi:biotin transport system substrate-specific component